MRRSISAALGGLFAFVGLVEPAGASATIDLIWAGNGSATETDVSASASITLRAVLTAGPNGSQGAIVGVDYSEALGSLAVLGYASTPGGALPIPLDGPTDTGWRIEQISSFSIPPDLGTGLSAGQSHQLGTVTFHKGESGNRAFVIRADANGPAGGVWDLEGNDITASTAFNTALLWSGLPSLEGPGIVEANPDGTFSYEVIYTPGPNEAFGHDSIQPGPNTDAPNLISDGFCWYLLPEGVPFLVGGGPISGALVHPNYPGSVTVEISTCPPVDPPSDSTASSLDEFAADLRTVSEDTSIFGGGVVHTTIVPFGVADLCANSRECAASEFCDTAPGACGDNGVCVEVPRACTTIFDPVCGCDGRTYGNACQAAQARVSVESSGPCPTPTPTATPSPTPTPEPTCADLWEVTRITTIGKGQSPTNNAKVSHTIFGHIVDPGALTDTAHRIPVCAGTEVNVAVTDSTGSPTNSADGSLSCDANGCTGVVRVTENFKAVSADGKDTDRITFLPE
jgi:hypothetical protein